MVFLYTLIAMHGQVGFAQEADQSETLYSIDAVSRIDGDRGFLSTLSTAHDSLGNNSLVISFGGLFGDTRIVGYDQGATFFGAAGDAGIDCILPSLPEFSFGFSRLRELGRLPGTPRIVAANLVDERSRSPVFSPYIVTTIGGQRILVIGMADPEIIRGSDDEDVLGIDIIPFDDAISDIMTAIAMEQADVIVVAGKLDRAGIVELSRRYHFIDYFITDNTASFNETGSITTATIANTPVYFVSGQKGHLGVVSMKMFNGIDGYDVEDIEYGEIFPVDPMIDERLGAIIDQMNRTNESESVIEHTGGTVTSVLYDMFDVDAVFIERKSLYYYEIGDSLNVTNVGKVIRPYNIMKTYDIKGSDILSVLERNRKAPPEMRLHMAGMEDAKIDSIPIQEDRSYKVLTTTFLSMGGNDYDQFTRGVSDETEKTVDMLESVERYLVAREERIREAMKPKYWEMNLHLDVGSYLNRQDVNREKDAYGNIVPKPLKDQKDYFIGNVKIESWNNTFRYARNNHQYDVTLHMKYVRAGSKANNGNIVYREADDNLILYNKYTYNHPGFAAKPYIDNTINSELYNPSGKHPITAKVTTGLTRKFPKVLNMVLNIGFSADRNYVTNDNAMGLDSKITFDQTFAGDSILSRKTTLHSETSVNYKPMARYHLALYIQNRNKISVSLMKKIDMAFNVNTFVYRDTTLRKVAVGVFYDFSLNYAMDWKL